MRTKPTSSKMLLQGKLQQSTLPKHFGRDKPCAKMILYCSQADMKIVEEAIAAVTDLGGVEDTGTPNGRAIVAICLAFLEGRGK